MIEEPTGQPAEAGDEEAPADGDTMAVAETPMELGPNGRLTINHGLIEGPRLMLLDVERSVWVPIMLAPGQWVLAQPLRSRLILPKGSSLS